MTTLVEIEKLVANEQRSVAQLVGAQELLQKQLSVQEERLKESEDNIALMEQVQAGLVLLEGNWRKTFEENLSREQTRGLSLVFGEGLELKIEGTTKAGASAINFKLDNGETETDVWSDGGSVVQVASFLFRVLMTMAHRPLLRKTILLDEPFGGVDEENVPALASLVRSLVDRTGMQVVMVTHDRSFVDVADVAVEIHKKNGIGDARNLKRCNEVHLVYDETNAA